jgi:hypothetical protein
MSVQVFVKAGFQRFEQLFALFWGQLLLITLHGGHSLSGRRQSKSIQRTQHKLREDGGVAGETLNVYNARHKWPFHELLRLFFHAAFEGFFLAHALFGCVFADVPCALHLP